MGTNYDAVFNKGETESQTRTNSDEDEAISMRVPSPATLKKRNVAASITSNLQDADDEASDA
jgi:hypothetical protein